MKKTILSFALFLPLLAAACGTSGAATGGSGGQEAADGAEEARESADPTAGMQEIAGRESLAAGDTEGDAQDAESIQKDTAGLGQSSENPGGAGDAPGNGEKAGNAPSDKPGTGNAGENPGTEADAAVNAGKAGDADSAGKDTTAEAGAAGNAGKAGDADSAGKDTATEADAAANEGTEETKDGKDGTESLSAGDVGWRAVYLKYLNELGDAADAMTYSLIYVDEDEIPELVMDSGYEAGGCLILTYHEGKMDALRTRRLHFDYIEKKNLLCNSDGNMGQYYDDVYTIQDGKWTLIGSGEWGNGEDGAQQDESGNPISTYRWDGEETDEDGYGDRLCGVYDKNQAKTPDRYDIFTEIYSRLRTGETASAGHRYELSVADVTWTEAQALCKEKGGYLATLTSEDELTAIWEQISAEEKTDITFWVGARNTESDGKSGCRWIESGTEIPAYGMLDYYNVYQDFWLEGEPSYKGQTESGATVDEDYVVLLCRAEEGKCYLNDVPGDLLSAAPSLAGKIGYICEYE